MDVRMEVQTPVSQALVFTDAYHPSWKASVDDRPARLYPADHAFRAIEVPEGRHRVRFFLAPFPYKIYAAGIFVSLAFIFFTARRLRAYSPKMGF